ncbi:2-dehydropantoate 2-reductase [Micromonospora phytophila]|uniref:2-dehydropantoate 2-reductase n=1 Tax=Micromonospora phytophila TaxID=709888 RepID=UPI00202F14E5|nr:2-dehydropantoate 2-reductase [Micromonospora phytophila]MCM0675153.1 2-dehydropantoate 2-reductase [Micromonospora phytophila]
MRIAVIGAGGIGGYFGGRLANAGYDVGFLARGAHLEAMRRQGLTVRSVAGDFVVPQVHASDDPGDLGVADVVLLAVKTWQLDVVVDSLGPIVGPDTAILTTQNGVDTPDRVAERFGRAAVLPGSAKIFANLDEPGQVRHVGGPGLLTYGEWDNQVTPRVDGLRRALDDAGVRTAVPVDIWTELWSKFLFVVPFGGLGAATDATIGVLRSRPGTRQLLVTLMREIRDVARARGIHLPDDILESTLAFVDQQPASGRSSLQRDILAGRPSELEAWTGAVVRLGAATGTGTPAHDMLYELLSARVAQSGLAAG